MRIVFGFPGWGWKMYGLMQVTKKPYWFIGFSIELEKKT